MTVLLGKQSLSTGGTGDFSQFSDTAAWKFTALASGDLKYLFTICGTANTHGAAKMGIYADNGSGTKPVSAPPLAKASVDVLADFNSATATARATLASTVTIVVGVIYWIGWWVDTADSHNFIGDAGGTYMECSGDFPNTAQGNWLGSTVVARIWGEDEPSQEFLPDADTVTTGWTTTPLHSKLSDGSDATVVTATLA